ncbi:agamous-like MADS-box protein AGL104 isoform X2 [Brassica napus]|uniref:agamous-like MADS-box protein AGL104 isoform X2 n=1 Tax=Brassica napus TaxID=3708 RepID=UPI00207A0CEA|nr:agamous-like MADS-box protein AGL104 isoform X2 [Brassica napus]
MGRAKLEIKPIQKSTNRQITYSKRKKGLIKKAYELSTLCDIDLALLMFSPSDRLCIFSSETRIEDVLAKYINLPDQEREKGIQNKEYLLRTLEQLKTENDMAFQINEPRYEAIHSDVKELEKELCRLQQQLQISEEELRKFEPDPVRFTSMEEMEACENHLLSTLTRMVQRREHLLSRSFEAPSTQQSIENIEGWEPEAEFKQARIIANSAYASNHYDLPLQGIISNPTQTPK